MGCSAAWLIADSAVFLDQNDSLNSLQILGWIVERVERIGHALEKSMGATAIYSPNLAVFLPSLIDYL
jgi:hypothetical protein